MALKKLGADRFWGGVDIREHDPAIDVVEDVYCLPVEWGGQWGIFDRADQVVPGTVDYFLPGDHLMAQDPTSPLRHGDIADVLPEGEYLYGGRWNNHFGHFLTETLVRLWPLAGGKPPGMKIITHGYAGPDHWAHDVRKGEILAGLGLTADDFLHIDRPTRIPRLQVPHSSFQQQKYAYPAYGRLCRAMGERLLGGRTPEPNDRPAWLSKGQLAHGVRRTVNEHEVEAVLARHGVEVIHPERFSFAELVEFFASRTCVLGTLQSGHNVSLFAPPVGRLLTLHPYWSVNTIHVKIDLLNGNDNVYLHPEGTIERSEPGQAFMVEATMPDPTSVAHELLDMIPAAQDRALRPEPPAAEKAAPATEPAPEEAAPAPAGPAASEKAAAPSGGGLFSGLKKVLTGGS